MRTLIIIPFIAIVTAAALVPAAASHLPAHAVPRGAPNNVAIFYYPWWGTPSSDGAWRHWQQNGSTPPLEIASNWYPERGPYSSADMTVVQAQMREIASMGVEVVIVSWWGPGSPEAALLPALIRAAGASELRVAVHVEPFAGRSAATLEPELRVLAAQGITDAYVYDSTATPDGEWRALAASLPDTRLFANTNLPRKAQAGGFAGLYTYDVRIYDGSSFPRMCASAKRMGLICAPSVGPGFDARRATGQPSVKPRANGATYDRMWRGAIRATADIVTITSFNEWHEGTQIEAAAPMGRSYLSYDGAYGLTGKAAIRAYLDRTTYWVGRWRARVGY